MDYQCFLIGLILGSIVGMSLATAIACYIMNNKNK